MRRCAALSTVYLVLVALLATGITEPSARAAGTAPISLGGVVGQDPVIHRLYVAQPATNKVLVFDSAVSTSMNLVGALAVPPRPAAIAVDTSRHLLYVASDDTGTLTRYDDRTLKKLKTLQLSGRPGGLSLMYGGNVLIITDAIPGEVSQLQVEPTIGPFSHVLSTGPGPNPTVMLTPASAWGGEKVVIWARDFLPGELVQVSWGMVRMVTLKADELGSIVGTFTVPKPANKKKPDLGPHLVVLIGQSSSRSQSTLLTAVAAPPPPRVIKPVPPKPPSPMTRRMSALFGIKVSLAAPGPLAIGPLKNRQVHVAWMYLVYVYIAATIMLLILRRARRRKSPPPPKKKKGPAPRRAALPARATA